jgi:hypothetical protein
MIAAAPIHQRQPSQRTGDHEDRPRCDALIVLNPTRTESRFAPTRSWIAPTLTLYYDALFRLIDERELLAGDLRICRLVGGAWVPLPTYLPAGYPFAVAPLTLETAGTLVAESAQARIEYYRVLWIPRGKPDITKA